MADGTVITTETRADGVKVKTVDEPGRDVTAEVTIPRTWAVPLVTIPADVDYGMVARDEDTGELIKAVLSHRGRHAGQAGRLR